MKNPKTRNSGQWTESRFRSFITSALRGARWPVKYEVIRESFVKHGINPKTGRKCKLCRCSCCGELFPQGQMQADHIIPVVGPEGFKTWDLFIERLFIEKEGYQALSKECHARKTKQENQSRITTCQQNHSPSLKHRRRKQGPGPTTTPTSTSNSSGCTWEEGPGLLSTSRKEE